jgi:hypothetical protein
MSRRPRIRRRDELAEPPRVAGRVIDAELDLLDHQVFDRDAVQTTTVDDLELSPVDAAHPDPQNPPELTSILTGPVLSTRVFGGRPPESRWARIAWEHVSGLGTVVELSVPADALDATWVERWFRDHIVARIPGGRHDPE